MMSEANKLALETKLVACDDNTNWALKPGHHTFIVPYLTDNHKTLQFYNTQDNSKHLQLETVSWVIDQTSGQDGWCVCV